jgi:hypothetical protein
MLDANVRMLFLVFGETSCPFQRLCSIRSLALEKSIPFGEVLRQTLVLHRQNSLHTQPEDFVFCRSDGSALQPDMLRIFAERPTGMQLHRDRQCDVKFSSLSIGRTF